MLSTFIVFRKVLQCFTETIMIRWCEMAEKCIIGQVSAIFFENPTNFYKVMRVSVDESMADEVDEIEITMTGQFRTIDLETTYEFFGDFVRHPRYGEQFSVTHYQQKAPTSKEGLIEYLSSKRFSGIGVVLATRIIDTLGENAIELIIEDEETLEAVSGMTAKKRKDLRETLLKYQGTERIFIQLSQWGISSKLADKIFQKYELRTLEVIKENPYQLIETIDGIAFKLIDTIACDLEIAMDDVRRLVAALYMTVQKICYANGDTYVEEENLLKQTLLLLQQSTSIEKINTIFSTTELLDEVTIDQLKMALDHAIIKGKLFRLYNGIMIPSLYYAEIGITQRLKQHMEYAVVEVFEEETIDKAIELIMQNQEILYDTQQKLALKKVIQSPVSVITGGPGTGKTTLIKGLIALHAQLHDYNIDTDAYETPVLLAAPTGRAAKRMNEMTQLPATTLHRLLGFNRDSEVEKFESREMLEGKLLIIDEMSMVDTWMMNWLLQSIPYELQVVFVGDKDQLPSVGPGKVFDDLIQSQCIPTFKLEKIYRQSQESTVISLAHDIRTGKVPQDILQKQHDRSFIQCHTSQVPNVIQQIVQKASDKQFTIENMQVLAPMYKGVAGITHLNRTLQEVMNPPKEDKKEITYFEQVFRVGDKVLQLVNNPDEDIYNGDMGIIVDMMIELDNTQEMTVAFEDKIVVYQRNEFEQLTLAYCCSVHKSQGSEYALVILPLVSHYSRMLRRNLLYTAVTRAKSRLVLVGDVASFCSAIETQETPRLTFLKELLEVSFKEFANIENSLPLISENKQANTINEQSETTKEPLDEFEQLTLTFEEELSVLKLTMETIHQIDPMIGMAGITPYDFMN